MRTQGAPDRHPGLSDILDELVAEAGQVVELDDDLFHRPPLDRRLDGPHTLRAQYATFLESLACARWAEIHLAPPSLVAFFSMGLFPALVHAGSLSLPQGLEIMTEVAQRSDRLGGGKPFRLGMVMGPTHAEVEAALTPGSSLEVTVAYGRRVSLVAGLEDEVEPFLEKMLAAGAPNVRSLPVSAPFHSHALNGGREELRALVAPLDVRSPRVPVLSSSTADFLRSEEALRQELAENISTPIRWTATMDRMVREGVSLVVECGFSREMGDLLDRDFPGACQVKRFVAKESK